MGAHRCRTRVLAGRGALLDPPRIENRLGTVPMTVFWDRVELLDDVFSVDDTVMRVVVDKRRFRDRVDYFELRRNDRLVHFRVASRWDRDRVRRSLPFDPGAGEQHR